MNDKPIVSWEVKKTIYLKLKTDILFENLDLNANFRSFSPSETRCIIETYLDASQRWPRKSQFYQPIGKIRKAAGIWKKDTNLFFLHFH